MVRPLRPRLAALSPTLGLALGLTTLLGGCVAYPAGYGYGYQPAPYYPAPVVAVGGWGWGRHHHGW